MHVLGGVVDSRVVSDLLLFSSHAEPLGLGCPVHPAFTAVVDLRIHCECANVDVLIGVERDAYQVLSLVLRNLRLNRRQLLPLEPVLVHLVTGVLLLHRLAQVLQPRYHHALPPNRASRLVVDLLLELKRERKAVVVREGVVVALCLPSHLVEASLWARGGQTHGRHVKPGRWTVRLVFRVAHRCHQADAAGRRAVHGAAQVLFLLVG